MVSDPENISTYRSIGFGSNFSEYSFVLIGDNGEWMRAIGTGFFIAPRLALTARHVMSDFWEKYNPGKPFPSLETEIGTNFKVLALQFLGSKFEQALWYAEYTWISEFTDVAFLYLKPQNDKAENYIWLEQLQLSMHMPKVDEKIFAFGYPSSLAIPLERNLSLSFEWKLSPVLSTGKVREVYEEYRDRSTMPWPSFETDARFEGGMSGGPVFNQNGQICGIVSSGMGDDEYGYNSWAALLGLAMFTSLSFQNSQVTLERPFFAFDLFEIKFLRESGWQEVMIKMLHLIKIEKDENGKLTARLKHKIVP